jgi:hypothetical protein
MGWLDRRRERREAERARWSQPTTLPCQIAELLPFAFGPAPQRWARNLTSHEPPNLLLAFRSLGPSRPRAFALCREHRTQLVRMEMMSRRPIATVPLAEADPAPDASDAPLP